MTIERRRPIPKTGEGRSAKIFFRESAARPSLRDKNLAFGDSCARERGVLGWLHRQAQTHNEA